MFDFGLVMLLCVILPFHFTIMFEYVGLLLCHATLWSCHCGILLSHVTVLLEYVVLLLSHVKLWLGPVKM